MRNPIVADWEKDPQYQALSQDEKAMALSNLFKTQAGGETSKLDPVTRNTVEADFVRQNMPGEALPSPNVAFSPEATTVDRANQLGEYFEKNALPEYHSLPEQQRRAIRNRFIEDNYDLLDAGAHARQQLGQAPKKEGEASGMLGALVSGTRRAASGLQTAANVVTGDDEDVQRLSKEAQEIPSTPQQQAFHEAVQSRIEESGDDSIWQGIKNIAGAAWEQPRGAMHEIAGQLPNSAVVMGSMFAGSKIGAKLGLIAGPKGSAIGAITGGIFGLIAGNIGIETGFIAQEEAAKGEYDRGETLKKGVSKGGVISGVDIATMGLNVVMFKAARNAVARTLTKAGVDPLDDAAVMAAIKAKPDLAVAVKKAGGTAALKFAPEGVRGAMVKAGGMGLETFGEGAGEYLGATAAGMDASFTEAVMEAMMSIPQSFGEVAISKAVAAGKHVMGKPEDAGKKQVLDAAGVGDDPKWQKAAEVLDSGKFPAPGTPEPTTGVTEPPPEGGPPTPPPPGAPQAPQGPTPEQVQADKQFIIDRITELQSRLENQNELLNKEAPGSERREKILKSARANQEEIETLSAELVNLEGGQPGTAQVNTALQEGFGVAAQAPGESPKPQTPEERDWEVAKKSEAGREWYRNKYGMYGGVLVHEEPTADVADATQTPSGEGKARWQPEAGDQIVSGEAVAAGLSPTEEDLAQLRGLEGDPFGTPQGGTRTAPSRTVPSGTGLKPQVAGQELTTGATKEQTPTPTMPDQKAGRVPTVFQYPSGRYGYAGNVDGAVAYVKKDGQTPTDEEIAEIARAQSPGMVMKNLGIVDRTFDTEQEAIDFAMSMGTKTQLPVKEGTPDALQQTQAQTQGGQQATQAQTQAQGEQAGGGLLSEPDDLPDIIKGKPPVEKERLGVRQQIEEASKPLTINAEKSNDKNLVVDEYHSDIAPTLEAWMHQMSELKHAIGQGSGRIKAGGRAARHPLASSSGILKNWTMLKRMENTLKQWQERFPGGQKEYDERQKAVQGLNVGDQVVTPYGEKGKIVRKNQVTWNIETASTGQVRPFIPAVLAPVEGAAAPAPVTPDVKEVTPDVSELTRKVDEHTGEFGRTWDTMDKKKRLTHIRKAGFAAPDGKVTAEGHQLAEKPWAKIPTDYKIRISGKEPTPEIVQMYIDKSELGQRAKEQYSGWSAKKDNKLRDDFPPTDKRARLNNARNYLKAVSEVLGWEPAVISKKVKNGIYINEAGMGGDATGIFWKPGSEYGIYISVLIDSTINSPKKSENGTIILIRATTKKDKYGGLGNNFVSYETTAEELARMAKSLVDSNEARAAVEQKAKGEARADKDAVPEFVRKDWMSTEDSVKARMLQKELENKGAGTIELGSERNVDFKIVQHDDGNQYGFQVVDQGQREEIFAEKGTGWTRNQAVVKAMETAERELRGVSDDVFRMAYTPRPGWRVDQQSAVEYALSLLPGKQKGQVKNWTLEKARAEIDAYNLPLERQFRSALERVGVSDKSDATAKIYKLRNTLGWGDTKFDNFIKYARLEGFIELIKGNPGELTNAQFEGSFADETSDVFTEIRLAGKGQKQTPAAATPERVEFDSLYVDYEGVIRQGKISGEKVELENDEGLNFVVHEDQQNKGKWAVSSVEYGVTVSMFELSKEDAISAADSSILNRESIAEYLQRKRLHFENEMKEQAAEAKPKQKFKIGDYVTPAPGSGLSGKNAGKIRHIQSDGSIATEGTGNMHFSEKDWVLSAPPTDAQTEPPPRPADYGAGNKVFTKERAEKARELLKKKLNQVGAGIDPEILLAGIEIAGYHVEAGARSFVDFTKAMVSDFGESIRPYLKTFYNAVRDYPDFNSEGMDSYASVDQQIEKEKAHGKEGSGLSDRGDTQGREPTETTGQERSATEQGGDTGTDKDVSTTQPAGGEELQGPGLSPGADTMGGQQAPGDDQRGGAGDRTDTMVSTPPISDIGGDRPSVGGLNYILRGKPPITLTKGERKSINAQVKELLDRGGPFTEAEKDILRQYTGEGGLSSGTKEALNQHYTDYPTIQAIYNALEAAGFKFKRILEPAGGSGNFVGLYPHADWTTIDIDETNHRVMQALYPDAKHYHQSFENFTSTGYDLIISNVPFLEMRGVEGRAVRSDIKNLHDFYFIHALDRVKDNGVIAFITSRGTMDKLDNKIRAEVVSKADVIGAYRLPGGHFEKNSHTSVVTDIIFLQKRPEGMQALPEQQKVNDSFVNSSETSDGIVLNEYYHTRMENLLGEVSIGTDKARFGKPTYAISQPADLGRIEVLYAPYRKAPGKTPTTTPKTPKEETEKKIDYSDVPRDSQEFGRWAAKNGVYVKEVIGTGFEKENVMVDVDSGRVQVVDKVISFTDVRGEGRIYKDITGPLAEKLVVLQTIANDIAKFQSTGDNVVQQEAMDYIEDYKKSFGTHPLKDKALKKLLKDVNEESYFAELSTLFGEDFSIPESLTTKTRYTGSGKAEITKDSPLRVRAFANENAQGIIHIKKAKFLDTQDGIKLLDMGYSLLEYRGEGLVFQNDILYYSGNIYKKIDSAKRMLEEAQGYGADELIPKLEEQIAKLEEVRPEPKAVDDINFKGNETWAMPILAKAGVNITREIDKRGNERYYFSGGGRSINHTLYEKWLNNNVLDNKDEDESPFYYYQRIKQLELAVMDINRRIRERIKMEPELVQEFEEAYNSRYRNYVKPQYDKAQYLIQDVLDEVAQNSPIKLRKNQIEWVIQAVYEGIGINAHDVGGGKTFAAIVLARVLKRRGVAQKPLFVVPAKTIHKWARDIKTLFPDAKVVNLGKLSKEKRTQALGALTNQNADYILVSMEGFGNIDLPRQDEARYVRQLVSENIDDPGASGREAGKLEERIAALEHSVLASERDERITLDKLGIDMIMADEAHSYKNIGIRPKLQRYGLGSALELKVKQGEYRIAMVDDGDGVGIFHPVTGERMNPDVTYTNVLDAKEAARRLPAIPDKVTLGSNRAYDFRFKASFIAERNNYKNIFLLTATPTPNKPMEIYTMLRHLSPRVFDEYGINSDVDFSRAFFDLGVSMDDASNRTKQVLRALKNAQELRGVLNRFVDKRTMQDLNIEGVPEQAPRKHVLQPPPEYNTIATDLRVRQANLVPKNARTEDDDLLISIYGQGRAAAIDPRLYRDGWAFHEQNYEEGHAPEYIDYRTFDPETDKIEFVISNVAENLKAKPDGHQLIFLDKPGHRLAKEGKISENIHAEMKAAIMERTGLKANEVAIISGQEITNPATGKEAKSGDKDLRKQEIADAYNSGQIKVVIGTTDSMGEGMDLQVHTTDIWNIDIPYVPGAFRQRLGRGVRFGNLNKVVKVHYLLMAGTFDNMSLDLVLRKKGWNEAIWDKEVADVISTEEEMTAGSVPQREQIMVELETDPVRKAMLMIQIKGRQLLSDHDTAQSTRMNREGYVATLERLQLAPLKDTITKRKQDVAEVYAKRQEMKEEAFEKSLAHRQKLLSSAERQLEETHAKIEKAKREVEEAHRMVVAAIARQEEFNNRFSAMVRRSDADGNPVLKREIVVPPDFDVNAPQYLAGEPPQQTREEDIRFKRAQPEPAGQPLVRAAYLERSVNRLLKRFSGLRKDIVVVAQSESQLPVPLQEQLKKQGMSGGYNAMIWNGKIYLVADNLTGGDKAELAVVEGLLRHEGRHYAIEKIFGTNKARDSFFGQVAEKYSDQVNEYLRSNKLENTPANRIIAAEEVIIDLIRAGETGGIIDRFIAKIAELLRQLFPNLKISNAEVRELIARADRIVEGAENVTPIGKWSEKGKGPRYLMGGPRLASEKGMADLETAKNMKGTPEEIWEKTGWWKLGDEWKFEISPENAHFDTNKLAGLLLDAVTSIQKGKKKLVPGKPLFEQAEGVDTVAKAPLGEVFHYPGLYDLFPMAQDVNLEIVLDGSFDASFDRPSNTLKLSIGNEMPSEVLTWITKDEIPADKFRSVIEHEVQHLVQALENFPRGGSPEAMASVDEFLPTQWAAKLQGAIQKAEARADKYFKEKTPDGRVLKDVEEAKEELRVIKALNAIDGYRLLTGEAEARMTQARLEMTPQQRKAEPPWVSLERLLRKEGLLKEGQELNDVLVDHYYERELVNKYIAFTGTANIWAPEPGFPNGRPRLDMIGTGHGVTAYGWGWYGAQSKKIAEYYRQAGLTPEQRETNKGNVYKLDIPDASKPKMLKWDSTWSEQTPFVRDALTKAGVFEIVRKHDEESAKAFNTVIRAKHFDPTGRAVYSALSSLQEGEDSGVKDKAAAEYLRSLGIVGNIYLDFSDKSGQASYDYVLWDQDTIDKIVVLERNEKHLPVPPSEMPEIQRRAQNLWSRAYSQYRAVPFWKRPFVQGLSEAKKSIWHTTGWWQDEKGKWLFTQPPTDTMRLDPKTLPWNRPVETTSDGGETPFGDKNIRFSVKKDYKPEKVVTAYKLFRTLKKNPGQLFPLFIGKKKATPTGEWLAAEFIPTKGYAERPGWHAGVLPIAPHLRSGGRISKDRVWAEIEVPADKEWQSIADKSKTRDIRNMVPDQGHYKFKTNKMQGGAWIIGGAIKIKRILTDDEVAGILKDAGYSQADINAEMHKDAGVFGQFQEKGTEAEVRFSRKPGPVGEGGTVNPLDSISAMVLEHTAAHALPGNVALRLIESVTDRLRRSNSKLMTYLADKVDTYYDQVDKRMGWWNGKLKPHLDAIGRKDRKKFYSDYEQFWKHHDNGRADEAQEVLGQAHPELAKMIDTVMDLFAETGSANQTVQQQKGRPDPVDYYFYHNGIYKQARAEQAFWRDSLNEDLVDFSEEEKEGITGEAPQYWRAVGEGNEKLANEILENTPGLKKFVDKVGSKTGVKRVSGMMVYDSTRGGYRPIRSTPRGKFYPRMIQAEVGRVLRDTSYRMGKGKELWSQMVDALIEDGHIIDASEAHRYLSGYFSKEIADDYFAGVEKARQKKLPEMFYDYTTAGISMYAYKWANRLSQVEQFGQDMGRGAPDLFDEVTAGFSDNNTKRYVEQIATQVYQKRQYDTLLSAMDAANILATATQLGNPATATLNLLGGTVLNWQLMGAKNLLKAFKDLVFDWKGIQQRSVELGIGGKDLMNILNDTERQASSLFSEETSIKRALSTFANFTMTWGGYRGTENIIRTWGMVGAQYQLQDAIGAHKKNPTGTLAGKYRALMERNGIDYEKVMAEGGSGDETAKYLRKMVNIPQGSYRIDQTPMYVDTRVGRFLFKYQKFGTQVSRMFWMNYLKPFMDAKTGADRFSAFMGLLGFFAKGIAGGSVILATRAALFGYRDPGPDDDDIKQAFENDDFHRGFGLVASRAFHNLMAASALGFFGNYVNFAMDVTDQQRPKNPFDPPALGTIKAMQDLVLTYLDQGTLSAGDLDNYLQSQLALYRGYKRAGTSIGSEFNSDWKAAQLFDAGMERGYARKAAMQFAKETGVKAKRQQSGMPVKSPMTPINRELYDALVLGDAATARAIVREALKGKNVKERREAILSMQASARARQPLSIQGRMTQKDRAGFYRWARENLAEENFNRVRNLDKQYRNTMVRAGLAKKTGWIPPEI